jgi:hypothetical protein
MSEGEIKNKEGIKSLRLTTNRTLGPYYIKCTVQYQDGGLSVREFGDLDRSRGPHCKGLYFDSNLNG